MCARQFQREPSSSAAVAGSVFASPGRTDPARHRFLFKVAGLTVMLIVLTALGITTATAFRFRRELFRQEYSSAFTVYTAVVNYLAGHYKSQGGRFAPRSLDYVLRHRLLQADATHRELITHRPEHLVLYDARGRVVYEFSLRPVTARAPDRAVSTLPESFEFQWDLARGRVRVGGPISSEGDVPGYVEMALPTAIRAKVRALWAEAFSVTTVLVLAAVGLSWVFTRHVLAPIEALTAAAERVHRGDLTQKVEVATRDEIGVLTDTFNEMVASLGRRISLLHRLQEWTVRIAGELESRRLYATLASMFATMSSATACRLYVWSKSSGRLELGFSEGAGALPPLEEDDLGRRAFEERRAQFRSAQGAVGPDVSDAVEVAIPLCSGEHRVGVARIGLRGEGRPYDEETLTILQTLAQHAAVAVENANLYAELVEKERIEQEMRWAREIQESLLPRETPAIPGYALCGASVPAFEVGGDYFDYVPANGRWYFAVADVSGKGVPAALIMSIVRSLIRTYVEMLPSPRDVLLKVHRKLHGDLDPGMFVTVALASLDPQTHRLCVARAGHEPALIRAPDGALRPLQPAGVGLGLVDIPTFERTLEEQEETLRPGESLVLYTDGITEARNAQGELFGYERLETFLKTPSAQVRSARELFDALLAEVRAFSGPAGVEDDMTLVVVQRLPGA